jgi:hypothetical protein
MRRWVFVGVWWWWWFGGDGGRESVMRGDDDRSRSRRGEGSVCISSLVDGRTKTQNAPVEVPRVVEGVDGGGEAAVQAEYPVMEVVWGWDGGSRAEYMKHMHASMMIDAPNNQPIDQAKPIRKMD